MFLNIIFVREKKSKLILSINMLFCCWNSFFLFEDPIIFKINPLKEKNLYGLMSIGFMESAWSDWTPHV